MPENIFLVSFKPSFIRQLNKLGPDLQNEVSEKIFIFKDRANHSALKVHKLHGKLANNWSFSVNYRYRIIFTWENKDEAVLLAIGDHEVYDR